MAEELNVSMSQNFIHDFIDEDIAQGGQYQGMTVHTRFPPEPNGYLHIGHCKALTIDFGTAEKYGGLCNLRMDDTNPSKEDVEYVEAIQEDIHWLGFDWGDRFFYASDYFPQMYEYAVELIKKGLAYVCELSPEEFKEHRGTIGVPATSPWRDRPVEESLDLFERMKNGEFENGRYTLRAKIDLASGNFNMRDPVIYRINHAHHHRQGDKWCIYPMYDFAHPIQDALEGITHSLCSLEFEAHRPLYDWVIANCDLPAKPRQIEFARLGINYTVMSKRKLRALVEGGVVSGWDDPRMPTLSGLRRRGYTPAAIRNFCERIGVAKANSEVETALLEHCVREDLNAHAPRLMGVLRPLRLIIENYPEGKTEMMTAEDLPGGETTHQVPFSRELYIEQEDFMEVAPNNKYFRLAVGKEVRLKNAYIIKCERVEKDEAGNITAVICSYDPLSKTGDVNASRKVKGTLHWVDAAAAVPAEYRIYDYLLREGEGDFMERLNRDSVQVLHGFIEPQILKAKPEDKFQLMRMGYFCADRRDFSPEHVVLNQIVGLKDTFAKVVKK